MRLDQFLKASRLCFRRASPQNFCDAGAGTVNQLPVRSSRQDASKLYEIVSEVEMTTPTEK
ncbi:MAG: hypothetical protein NVSMB56_14150 [Pyrinomonadaceae bacterium]